jgi:hypothetical protein
MTTLPQTLPFILGASGSGTSTPPTLSGVTRNLRPYQWQIGDLVFGPYTSYPILGVNPASYNVNAQDYQVALSDETRMAQDTLQAQPITFTIGVRDNAPVPNMANMLPADLITKSSRLLTALQSEWKGNEVRLQWGALKPLIFCDGYGSVRRVYGRPRKFQYTRKRRGSSFHKVTCEYARADTLSHSDIEYAAALELNTGPETFTRLGGDADSWLRVLLTGPQTNPIVVIGNLQIQLQTVIAAGVQVEVNSYPWTRRIIDSNGVNGRTWMIGNTKYLDQLHIPPNTPLPMSWSATGTTSASACTVLWRDAYNTI